MLGNLQELNADAAKLAASALWPLSDTELVSCLQAAHRVEQAVAVLKHRIVQQADTRGIPAAHGHRSTTGWLRALLLIDHQPAAELAKRARLRCPADRWSNTRCVMVTWTPATPL